MPSTAWVSVFPSSNSTVTFVTLRLAIIHLFFEVQGLNNVVYVRVVNIPLVDDPVLVRSSFFSDNDV
jgi:hypothetical protein